MEDFGDLAALAVAQTRALTEARQRAEDLAKSQEALEAQLDERDAEVIGLREQVRSRRDDREAYRGMVGKAPAMQKLYRLIDRLSGSDVPVVIHGESGTGKELVARALHEAGPRAAKPFVAENCGAIPESLLESLFFGHARGAFTGANSAKAGLIEAADGGTIFLDEIGEMSMAMQTKLLRVLQEGEVRRVGETRTRKVDVRVVAASNRDLEAMVECGAFRRDLFYRINVVRLELPALRERREDIAALVEHFARAHGRADIQVSARAMRQLMRYPWPGNVRELENEVQRWIALVEDKVRPDDLARAIAGAQGEVDDPDDLALKPRVDRLERELIARALDRTGGNQTHAAELLGLSRYGLQKKLKRLNEVKATT
jgi:DNA-binding NtrC family response regulator